MILYTNLKEVKVNNVNYLPIPILKLTSMKNTSVNDLKPKQMEIYKRLKMEADKNNFKIELD